jgi:hypothetical protein
MDECISESTERVPVNGIILKVQVVKFNELLNEDETFKAPKCGFGGGRFNMEYAKISTGGESASDDRAVAVQFPETLCKSIGRYVCMYV